MGESGWKVIISAQAERDLHEIVAFIAADNPAAAERFGLRLISEAEAVGLYPMAGRMVPEFDEPTIRERVFKSYRIVYRVEDHSLHVVISRFWHAARDRPYLVEE